MLWLAQRMGVSDRHLRRIFEQQLGVSPLQYLQTRKLLTAKQLLADTTLPVSQVALTSGFGSLRRFNAAIRDRYGLSPSQMRQGARSGASLEAGSSRARLFWRPPLDVNALLGFLAQRQLPGMERVDTVALSLTRSLRLDADNSTYRGWLRAQFHPERCAVDIAVSEGLQAVLPQVLWRLRALFDLDADPQAINACLSAEFPGGDGLRVPGCVDGFELAVRAVLGQQITVAAARTLAQRLLEHFGEAMVTPDAQVQRLFPTPQALAAADAEQLGAIGIVRQRQAAIQALARAVADGTLDLSGQADLNQTLHRLQALPGIGPWTAQYIAMRALRWPDAWPVGDVAVHQALSLNPVRGSRSQPRSDRARPRLAALAQLCGHPGLGRAAPASHLPTHKGPVPMKRPNSLQRCSIDSHSDHCCWQRATTASRASGLPTSNTALPTTRLARRTRASPAATSRATAKRLLQKRAVQPFSLPLDIAAGTAFQQAVWRALLDIPAGQTRSYAQVAHAVGRPTAVRAVGAAIGRNPVHRGALPPCTRRGGALTGYAGGLGRKTALLSLEGAGINAVSKPHH